ncbi:unnamed protein product [Microthlaspi erraticum]|uniref:Replication protein A 70 kDa DNA-binding subunit B/D first OB fold domain-containing protein n=1 Tax=Microthlaspi erraticum TaxID=1685480 RepID=A0A6D2HMB3_9BRAS|nr:unnamed protein product [Microthlaspi erraticum]
MAMEIALPVSLCTQVKPFKTAWRIQVKILWKFIQNFSVAHSTGHYRTTPNPYKIAFIKETFVLPSTCLGDGNYLTLVTYRQIHDGNVNESILHEVKSVSNAYSSSVMLINPPYPEIDAFAKSIPDDGLLLTIASTKPDTQLVVKKEQEKYWEMFPMSTIGEVLALDTVGTAKIMCTVYTIDTDMGWYYIACTKYQHNKVKKVMPGPNQKILLGSKQKWFCLKCNANITNVVAR